MFFPQIRGDGNSGLAVAARSPGSSHGDVGTFPGPVGAWPVPAASLSAHGAALGALLQRARVWGCCLHPCVPLAPRTCRALGPLCSLVWGAERVLCASFPCLSLLCCFAFSFFGGAGSVFSPLLSCYFAFALLLLFHFCCFLPRLSFWLLRCAFSPPFVIFSPFPLPFALPLPSPCHFSIPSSPFGDSSPPAAVPTVLRPPRGGPPAEGTAPLSPRGGSPARSEAQHQDRGPVPRPGRGGPERGGAAPGV